MAKTTYTTKKRPVEQYEHKGKQRVNNPPVGLLDAESASAEDRKKYAYDPPIESTLQFDQQKGCNVVASAFARIYATAETESNGRSLFPCQVFRLKLAKNLRADIDEEAIQAYYGTVSLPFKLGKHSRVDVKIIAVE